MSMFDKLAPVEPNSHTDPLYVMYSSYSGWGQGGGSNARDESAELLNIPSWAERRRRMDHAGSP